MNKQPGQINPIKEINIKLRPSNNQGLFHDSRADARTCMEALNICINKINEIVQVVNKIQEEAEPSLRGGVRDEL